MSRLQGARTRTGLLALAASIGSAVLLLPAAEAAAAPNVTAISGRWFPTLLSPTITVSGNGFTGATAVTETQSFTVVDDHTIKATLRPGGLGTSGVRVTVDGQTSPDTPLDHFTRYLGPDLPMKASVAVTCTLGGSAGATFAGSIETSFAHQAAYAVTADVPSSLGDFSADLYVPDSTAVTDNPLGQPVGNATVTSIDADVSGATTSSLDLSATSPNAPFPVGTTQSSNPMAFGIGAAAASSITATGKASPVTISLRDYHAKVTLDGGGTPVVTSLDCLPTSTKPLIGSFNVNQPVPRVTSISTSSGPTTGGTAVQIIGTNLANTSSVTLGAPAYGQPTPAVSFHVVSDSRIDITTPAHLPGATPISVGNSGGFAPDPPSFTFVGSAETAPVTIAETLTCTMTPTFGSPITVRPTITLNGSAPTSVAVGEPVGLTAVTATVAYSAADIDVLRGLTNSFGVGGTYSVSATGAANGTGTAVELTTSFAGPDLSSVPAGSGITAEQTISDLDLGAVTAAPGGSVVVSTLTYADQFLGTSNTTGGTNPTKVSCTTGVTSISIPVAAVPVHPTGIDLALKGALSLKTLAKGTAPVTGSLVGAVTDGTFAGNLTIAPTTAKLVALGFLPVTAQMAFTQVGQTTGTLGSAGLTTNSKLRIKLPSISVAGVKLASGGNCQAAQLSPIKLTANPFTATGGGTLAGTFAISNLTGCGNLTGLVSPLTAGSGNAIALVATAVAG